MDDMENTIDDMIHYHPSSNSHDEKHSVSEGLREILIHCIKKNPGKIFINFAYIACNLIKLSYR